MFCPNCGTQIEDTANFCPNCGSEISRNESSAEVITAPVKFEDAPKDDARAAVKNIAKSGLFVAGAILLTAGILINLLTSIGAWVTADSLLSYYHGLAEGFDADALQMMNAISSGVATGAVIGTIIGFIPWILNIIGIWITFGSAAKKENLCPSVAGLTICKGVAIADMVIVIVAMAIAILGSLLVLIAGAVGASVNADSEVGITYMIVGGVMFLIIALTLVYCIIYYVKLLKTIKAVRSTIETGIPTASVSRLIIFMCFFTGALNGIVSLISLSIGGMAVAAAYIIFGIILIKYKKQMTYLRDNGNFTAEVINIQ